MLPFPFALDFYIGRTRQQTNGKSICLEKTSEPKDRPATGSAGTVSKRLGHNSSPGGPSVKDVRVCKEGEGVGKKADIIREVA